MPGAIILFFINSENHPVTKGLSKHCKEADTYTGQKTLLPTCILVLSTMYDKSTYNKDLNKYQYI